uniref:Putative eukaryotic translation initiation factor 5a n=1 Tax=Haematobia irritans TaxID=7368 RepID=A0A1L8E9Q0_HAEIR
MIITSKPAILVLLKPILCNVLHCVKTVLLCSRADPAKLLKCLLQRQANTVTLKSIWSELISSQIKKYEDICPSTHNMYVPHVKREDYQLTDISDDGYLTLMADNGEIREALKLPDGDLGNSLSADFDNGKDLLCTVLKSCGEECVIAIKTNTALDK